MDKSYWGDPQNFRPERFLDSNGNLFNTERVINFSLGNIIDHRGFIHVDLALLKSHEYYLFFLQGRETALENQFLRYLSISLSHSCSPILSSALSAKKRFMTLFPCQES